LEEHDQESDFAYAPAEALAHQAMCELVNATDDQDKQNGHRDLGKGKQLCHAASDLAGVDDGDVKRREEQRDRGGSKGVGEEKASSGSEPIEDAAWIDGLEPNV
jgi:hypothetical protein